jgi:hypothetical protein
MFRSRNNKQKQKYQFSDLKMEKKNNNLEEFMSRFIWMGSIRLIITQSCSTTTSMLINRKQN